jgi:hypothetical protein
MAIEHVPAKSVDPAWIGTSRQRVLIDGDGVSRGNLAVPGRGGYVSRTFISQRTLVRKVGA